MRLETNVPVAFVNNLDDESFLPMGPQLGATNSTTASIDVTRDIQGFGDCPDFNWDRDIVRFWDFQPLDGDWN